MDEAGICHYLMWDYFVYMNSNTKSIKMRVLMYFMPHGIRCLFFFEKIRYNVIDSMGIKQIVWA